MTVTDRSTATKPPTVVLDTTIADLYRQGGAAYKDKRIGQVLSGFSALVPLSDKISCNRKYIYQDSPFTSNSCEPRTKSEDTTTAIKYLSLINQRDEFICGNAPVVFFHMDTSSRKRDHDRKQVMKTLATLVNHQRPQPIFCEGPDSIPTKESQIDLLAVKVIGDDLENGLGDFVIPDECAGARGTWLKEQSLRLYEALKSQLLPFVLKNQATFGGAGTFIVKTEQERQNIIDDDMRNGFLNRLLSAVNARNSHLEPATMLLSDLVQDPIGDYGVTFFVNEKGSKPTFLGVSKQMIEGGTAWVGSIIDYQQQTKLHHKFEALMDRISDWLQSYGYIGPAGADILEDAKGFHVVDLNVRTTGSCCLPLLQTHFTSRGLHLASAFSINVQQGRNEFLDMFRTEIYEGRMCIMSWYEDPETRSSLAEFVIGGENDKSLKELMGRVSENSKSVTF
ncbi:uncharacterized protein FIESC28_03601 [Fusarium coffeatum]|uniref:ATP-grasp fold PylC-type domain-containing protein n=1 Tax=Fusarium coffeatum TaxID=231269 RepID=A0A366S3Z4_9HYPO|nr:uncharacterized protein FIESC28_03601 [Fusarium coffeatum]RBR23588.1 hypothetical protein FIESC28_03601 [Fusarium coffeatum]